MSIGDTKVELKGNIFKCKQRQLTIFISSRYIDRDIASNLESTLPSMMHQFHRMG